MFYLQRIKNQHQRLQRSSPTPPHCLQKSFSQPRIPSPATNTESWSRIKLPCDRQGLRKLTSHTPFLRKLLEDKPHQGRGWSKKVIEVKATGQRLLPKKEAESLGGGQDTPQTGLGSRFNKQAGQVEVGRRPWEECLKTVRGDSKPNALTVLRKKKESHQTTLGSSEHFPEAQYCGC